MEQPPPIDAKRGIAPDEARIGQRHRHRRQRLQAILEDERQLGRADAERVEHDLLARQRLARLQRRQRHETLGVEPHDRVDHAGHRTGHQTGSYGKTSTERCNGSMPGRSAGRASSTIDWTFQPSPRWSPRTGREGENRNTSFLRTQNT